MYTVIIRGTDLTYQKYASADEADRSLSTVEECECAKCFNILWAIVTDAEGVMHSTWRRSDDRFLKMSMHHFA